MLLARLATAARFRFALTVIWMVAVSVLAAISFGFKHEPAYSHIHHPHCLVGVEAAMSVPQLGRHGMDSPLRGEDGSE